MRIYGRAFVSALHFLILAPEFFLLAHGSRPENIPFELLFLCIELLSRRCVPYGFEQSRLSTYVIARLSTFPTGIYYLSPALQLSLT